MVQEKTQKDPSSAPKQKAWKTQLQKDLSVYEFAKVLPGSGQEIIFKPLTTKDLKKLLIYEKASEYDVIEEALDTLLSSVVIAPKDFNVLDMYTYDRISLLMAIRIRSKGSMYQFQWTCPKCKSQTLQTVYLDQMPEKRLDYENVNREMKITENVTLKMDFVTRREQKEGYSLYFKNKKLTKEERTYYTAMVMFALSIRGIKVYSEDDPEISDVWDEDLSLQDRIDIIENIPKDSLEVFREWYEENQFGLDMNFERYCDVCQYKEVMMIPMGDFF